MCTNISSYDLILDVLKKRVLKKVKRRKVILERTGLDKRIRRGRKYIEELGYRQFAIIFCYCLLSLLFL